MIERNCFDFRCFPVMEERNKKNGSPAKRAPDEVRIK